LAVPHNRSLNNDEIRWIGRYKYINSHDLPPLIAEDDADAGSAVTARTGVASVQARAAAATSPAVDAACASCAARTSGVGAAATTTSAAAGTVRYSASPSDTSAATSTTTGATGLSDLEREPGRPAGLRGTTRRDAAASATTGRARVDSHAVGADTPGRACSAVAAQKKGA
jgi:hypothetical protein